MTFFIIRLYSITFPETVDQFIKSQNGIYFTNYKYITVNISYEYYIDTFIVMNVSVEVP